MEDGIRAEFDFGAVGSVEERDRLPGEAEEGWGILRFESNFPCTHFVIEYF